jgi:hypothetical protein
MKEKIIEITQLKIDPSKSDKPDFSKPLNYLYFLIDDLENGLLKNKRVGMIRRTVKIRGGVVEDSFIFLPMIKNFIVLNVKGRFE